MPSSLNDGSVFSSSISDAINEYVEIDFGSDMYVSQFRYVGDDSMAEDGTYKIQHWDGSSWVNNVTGIPTKKLVWSDWTLLSLPVLVTKIRFVATAIDTGNIQGSYCGELEMRG